MAAAESAEWAPSASDWRSARSSDGTVSFLIVVPMYNVEVLAVPSTPLHAVAHLHWSARGLRVIGACVQRTLARTIGSIQRQRYKRYRFATAQLCNVQRATCNVQHTARG